MALVTLREAARLVGRARQTVYRDAKAGILSTSSGQDGTRLVDTSELMRAYGPLRSETAATVSETGNVTMGDSQATPSETGVSVEIAVLRVKLEAAEAAARNARDMLELERAEKGRLLGLLESQARLLEHQRPEPTTPEPEPLKRWWRRG